MSRHLSVEEISTLISQLPATSFGKIDWRKSPKQVALIVKALISSKDGIVTLVSKASGVHNQTLYAVMRGKTPDGGKEWPQLREALSKMKCEWRGKTSATAISLVTSEVTSLMKPEVTQGTKPNFPPPSVAATLVEPVKNRKSKTIGKQVSTQVQKVYDFETKELVVTSTVRYTIDAETLTDLLNA